MPVSPHEARRRAKEMKATKSPVHTYVITDLHFRPNQHGLGGVKTFVKNGKHCIVLTPQQAKYWVDAGVMEQQQVPEPKK